MQDTYPEATVDPYSLDAVPKNPFEGSGLPIVDIEAESIDILVVGGSDYSPHTIRTSGSIPFGVPHKGAQYTSEDHARADKSNRTLGVPYSIKTEIQEQARNAGY